MYTFDASTTNCARKYGGTTDLVFVSKLGIFAVSLAEPRGPASGNAVVAAVVVVVVAAVAATAAPEAPAASPRVVDGTRSIPRVSRIIC